VELAGQISDAGRVGAPLGHAADFNYTMISVFGMATAVVACAVIGGPSLRLPLSRSRLAACVSVETFRLSAMTFAGYAAGVLGMSALAGAIACRPFEFARFGRPLVCVMVVPPLALVALTILFLTARIRWIPPLGALGFCLLAGICAVVIGIHYAAMFVALPGLLAWAIFAGLAAWACWTALQRFYLTCDLSQSSPWTKNMSTGR
jgi:hypothetical protein